MQALYVTLLLYFNHCMLSHLPPDLKLLPTGFKGASVFLLYLTMHTHTYACICTCCAVCTYLIGFEPNRSIKELIISLLADHRIDFNLDNLRTPESHKDLVSIMEEAHNGGRKVRVLAAGHSWSEIAQTQDIMISLHGYSGIIKVENLTVTVKAGTKLSDLSEALDKHAQPLAMINLGSVAGQSLGGAISTGESLLLHCRCLCTVKGHACSDFVLVIILQLRDL